MGVEMKTIDQTSCAQRHDGNLAHFTEYVKLLSLYFIVCDVLP